jgi:hypothetical protein
MRIDKRTKRIIYFALSLIFFEGIGVLLQRLLVNSYLFVILKYLRINLGLFGINLIGFVIPAIITLVLFIYIIFTQRKRISQINAKSLAAILGITLLWLFIIFLSLNYLLIGINNVGSETSLPILLLVSAILLYYVAYKRDYKLSLPLSYILGFLLGASSDFIGTFGIVHLSSGIWGGGAFLDGDFYIPLILVISILITKKLEKRNEENGY